MNEGYENMSESSEAQVDFTKVLVLVMIKKKKQNNKSNFVSMEVFRQITRACGRM